MQSATQATMTNCVVATDAIICVFDRQTVETPQSYLVDLIDQLYSGLECEACRHAFDELAERIASHIDGRVQTWGNFDWHRIDLAVIAGPS